MLLDATIPSYPQLLSFGQPNAKPANSFATRRVPPEKGSSFSKAESVKPALTVRSALQKISVKSAMKVDSKQHSASRRVCFDVDDTDKVVTETCYFEKAPAKYNTDLYWSSREKSAIQCLAKSEGETFLMDNEDFVESLDKAFLSCCRDDISDEDNSKNLKTICYWALSEVRGLEDVVSTEFHDERALAGAMILDYQVYLAANASTMDDIPELLRAFSEKVSSRTREYAAKMGAGDAFAAKRM